MDDIVTIIESQRRLKEVLNLKKIYRYKDLFFELTLKDIKLRYKQTILGIIWAIFQPLLSTLIFTLFFGVIMKIPADGLPYPVFVYCGLMFWNFFSNSLVSSSGSLVGNESLIKKIYFPRIIIPLSSIGINLFDFGIMFIFFVVLCLIYNISITPIFIVGLLLSLLLTILVTLGSGLFLAALNVKYRDVRHILPFFIQILIFVTPVIYPVSIISSSYRWLLSLNPLTTSIDVVRKLVSGQINFEWMNILISFLVAIIILLVGVVYFSKTEDSFADNI